MWCNYLQMHIVLILDWKYFQRVSFEFTLLLDDDIISINSLWIDVSRKNDIALKEFIVFLSWRIYCEFNSIFLNCILFCIFIYCVFPLPLFPL